MKTCPLCGIALKDEYLFCPEDGARLGELPSAERVENTAPVKPPAASAVVLYCPACAAEYPLTFSECPVHQTALTTHGIPALVEAPPAPIEAAAAKDPLNVRHLHLVPSETPPEPAPQRAADAQTRRSSLEEYEQTLENLAQPLTDDHVDEPDEVPEVAAAAMESRKYRGLAAGVAAALALLALVGVYSVISNATRKPAQPAAKKAETKAQAAQSSITVQTPQAALDYQEPATATASLPAAPAAINEAVAPSEEPAVEAQARTRRGPEPAGPRPDRAADAPPLAAPREAAAPSPRPAQPAAVAPAAVRQPAATELVLPRGTYGLVDARLAGVRASRTAAGYRYDLTFHMADQAGHATQWERLAITTRAASGASRQQQIPFYHRLGADGTLRFTVSVEMPGRAPADWQGRIICTSIGSDSSGKSYRASFGANVSPN